MTEGSKYDGFWFSDAQIPAATPAIARPVTAFLTRYGRRARSRAADWAFCRV